MALTTVVKPDLLPPFSVRLLLGLARRAHRKSAFHRGSGAETVTSRSHYESWRAKSLEEQLRTHFDPSRLAGKDVLDFGCGSGALSEIIARDFKAASVIGIDMDSDAIERACDHLDQANLTADVAGRLSFRHATDDRRIDLPDESCDIICCFDVLEHIPNVSETLAEWQRVLRPGGEVWIWWSPWMGPYGHHVESLIPLPWVHLLFSPATVFAVCAEIFDDPDFVPRLWDIDAETGTRRANKWRDMKTYEPFLNRMRSEEFEGLIRKTTFDIRDRRRAGFAGSSLSRSTRFLIPLPLIGECFVSYFTYRLTARPS